MPTPKRPIEDRLLDGTYKPSKHGPVYAPPQPAETLKKPAALTGKAGAVWKELVETLGGTVRRRDVPALAELCRWIERSDRVAKELDALAVTDPEFKALLVCAGICADKIASLSAKFGATPVDGQKVPQPDPAKGVRWWT